MGTAKIDFSFPTAFHAMDINVHHYRYHNPELLRLTFLPSHASTAHATYDLIASLRIRAMHDVRSGNP